MKEKILNLEKSLFQVQYMSHFEYLNEMIEDSYEEVGKSGLLFHKQDIIKDLMKQKEDKKITIYNYSFQEITENVYLVHYITKSGADNYYRTSLWEKRGEFKNSLSSGNQVSRKSRFKRILN